MIRTHQLCRRFHVGDSWVHALDEVDLHIRKGDFVAVMGPSGSGKSTLMNILGCLDTPNDGQYRFLEQEVARLDDAELSRIRNEQIGFVFQSFHLLPRLTAVQNVVLPLRYSDIDFAEAKERGEKLLTRLGLADRMDHRPNQLSGGQRQRVAIARATVTEPNVMLADEPTGNLDHKSGMDVIHILEQLNQRGITLIMVTHDPEMGQRARRQLRMVDGRLHSDVSSHDSGRPGDGAA